MTQPKNNPHTSQRAIFHIQRLNTPWKEIAHLGVRKQLSRDCEATVSLKTHFLFLEQGTIRLSGISSAGQERIFMYMGQETIAGELAFLHSASFRTHSLRTQTPCRVIYFPNTLLDDLDFATRYPHLMMNLVRSIGIKAGAFFSQIYDNALLSNRTQVCRTLYDLWQQNGRQSTFSPGLSQSDLTAIIGIHRSSVCRALKELRQWGVVGHFSKTCLEILDPQRLTDLAELAEINGF